MIPEIKPDKSALLIVDMQEYQVRKDWAIFRLLNAATWTWIYNPDLLGTGWYDPKGEFDFGRSNNKKAIPLIEAGREEVNEAKKTKIY